MTMTPYGISEKLRTIMRRLTYYAGEMAGILQDVDRLRAQVEEQYKDEIMDGGRKDFLNGIEITPYCPKPDERDAALAKIQELQRQLTTDKPKENKDA